MITSLVTAAFFLGGLPAVATVLEIASGLWILWIGAFMGALALGAISGDLIVGVLATWLDSFFGV